MIEETFIAPTPKEAYELAQEKYGSCIKILSAKQIKDANGRLRAELTIAIDKARFESANALSGLFEASSKERALAKEVARLRQALRSLPQDRASFEQMLESSQVQEVINRFVEKGIARSWLKKLLEGLSDDTLKKDKTLLAAYVLEAIDESITINKESLQVPLLRMVVGPTGVGKTTTLAKLAARYAFLLETSYKVMIVNLDTYKVGAHEQLEAYARIMDLEYRNVYDLESFSQTLEEADEFDIVLIDTAGMSPYDTQKFLKAVEFLERMKRYRLEVDLVLPATVKFEDMKDIYESFSFLGLSGVVLTKFDETRHFGNILNFMLLYSIPISYFSIGQEVPDDLIVADKEYLLSRFIGELDNGSKSSV